LQESAAGAFAIDELCRILSNLTGSDVAVQTEAGMKGEKAGVPIIGGSQRLGTLILTKGIAKADEDDLVLLEYAAALIGFEMQRRATMIQMALGTLSYSELEAVSLVFKELNGMEGYLIASKIADRSRITRSVIVSALRKLESAGVVESRSLGMKGTYIKILNSRIIESIEKMRS